MDGYLSKFKNSQRTKDKDEMKLSEALDLVFNEQQQLESDRIKRDNDARNLLEHIKTNIDGHLNAVLNSATEAKYESISGHHKIELRACEDGSVVVNGKSVRNLNDAMIAIAKVLQMVRPQN